MYQIYLILFAMLALQFMGLGLVLGKIGESKTGMYSGFDVIVHIIMCLLYVYVIWFLYHNVMPLES